MNFFKLSMLVVLTATLALGGTGCKKPKKNLTQIPAGETGTGRTGVDTPQAGPILTPGSGLGNNTNVRTGDAGSVILPPATTDGSLPPTDGWNRDKFKENREALKASTVYFDYDRSTIRVSERARVEEVAILLKNKPTCMVEIEGHCDERGTEEYNRALGERRALAVREYLVNLGIQPERVHTISYGEDRPAEIGSSEGAWAKNRRGEFILLEPRQ